jgi:hypothetical protein
MYAADKIIANTNAAEATVSLDLISNPRLKNMLAHAR